MGTPESVAKLDRSVGSLGTWDLQLVSEWRQSCGSEPLTVGVALTPDSVRIELLDAQLVVENQIVGF